MVRDFIHFTISLKNHGPTAHSTSQIDVERYPESSVAIFLSVFELAVESGQGRRPP